MPQRPFCTAGGEIAHGGGALRARWQAFCAASQSSASQPEDKGSALVVLLIKVQKDDVCMQQWGLLRIISDHNLKGVQKELCYAKNYLEELHRWQSPHRMGKYRRLESAGGVGGMIHVRKQPPISLLLVLTGLFL